MMKMIELAKKIWMWLQGSNWEKSRIDGFVGSRKIVDDICDYFNLLRSEAISSESDNEITMLFRVKYPMFDAHTTDGLLLNIKREPKEGGTAILWQLIWPGQFMIIIALAVIVPIIIMIAQYLAYEFSWSGWFYATLFVEIFVFMIYIIAYRIRIDLLKRRIHKILELK